MTPMTLYLMVGVVAAIAVVEDVGIVGAMMLLFAWPIFLCAGLATHGFPGLPSFVRQQRRGIPSEPDLRLARLRGAA